MAPGAVTASSPTELSAPLAGAQSLRQRHGVLSPLRLGVYGLVSLGSHLLLLGLFRWAWQVQLATQPLGSPIGIDFVEVDLSDGSFADQLPRSTEEGSSPGAKLNAAQLNELLSQGTLPSADALAEDSNAVRRDNGAGEANPPDTTPANDELTATQPVGPTQEQPKPGGGLFGGPLFPTMPSPPSLPKQEIEKAVEADDLSSVDAPETSVVEASSGERAGEASNPVAESNGIGPSLGNPPATTETEDEESTAPPASESQSPGSDAGDAELDVTQPEGEGATLAGDDSSNELSDDSNKEPSKEPSKESGPPNPLPPNISQQPVASNQAVESNEPEEQPLVSEPDNEPQASDEVEVSGTTSEATDAEDTPGGEGGAASGGGSGEAPGAESSADVSPEVASGGGTASEPVSSEPSSADNAGTDGDEPASSDGAVTRLGADLVVDEVQSKALNTQDVFTRLPRPLGDPLSNGSQSVNSGRCAVQLAGLTPASYRQPVQLILAVDVLGEVFSVQVVDAAQAQTPLGQSVACLAEAWPFEPAQRVINEGGGEKVENAGAVLAVTVTISLRD